ncbi:acyl-CoA thioesterase [Bosea sp. (in: a-proteobacteria)]|uniref:acyl-CoA thioesterase n=1 Tax=Bosea sp. (in: a-proteobacteria) TaxID=1871050 RepID=UPI002FC8B563
MSDKPVRLRRADFRRFRAIPTRWADNDVFGHVNNVIYYNWFDTVVNAWLIEQGFLDIAESRIVGLVVGTRCDYFESVAFPEVVEGALAVERLGRSSVTYRIGIFRQGCEATAAQGLFTHVYVERGAQKPVPIPEGLRAAMAALQL